ETKTGPWRHPPTAKLEHLLRHTGIPIGFVTNRRELRLVYAPPGEASAHLTFRFKDLAERAGRPLVAALELLFHAARTYGAAPEFTFEGLLRDSRLRQADVTKDLAAQVFEGVEILLQGFEHAAARDCVGDRPDSLRAALEEPGDHFYQGILSVVLRLVFILYAEDQSLLPVHHPTYAAHLSILGLYASLANDAGAHPESMHLRFGAYGRLIALFRVVFLGIEHEDLRLPPRRGKLFDPSAFPFLEGGLPGWTAAIVLPEERAAVQLPSIDDETIYRVLHRLVVFKGQRLSYRSLDVEQIGAVYESLMGYHVLRLESPAVRLGKVGVWAETEVVRAMAPTDRKRFWKGVCSLSKGAATSAEAAVAGTSDAESLFEALAELAPGTKSKKKRHWAAAGRLALQPGEERRRTGSHYTPRWLSEKIVKRTLGPILACLGDEPTAKQILSLKICDPAMGSGAFLVAACRQLSEALVAAWDRADLTVALTEKHGDALLHARRLVVQRCLYGVDSNAAAVELAKLSLWLVTLSKELPFTFVDHALRHGDALVGLDLDQIRSFHWVSGKQNSLFELVLRDALDQAIEHRHEILKLADREDASGQNEKRRLLEYADHATEKVRTLADVCIGAFFAESNDPLREAERIRRQKLVEAFLSGDAEVESELHDLAIRIREQRAPFHWWLEFPEIFYEERPDPLAQDQTNGAAFMEAFIGNPPFVESRQLAAQHGKEYLRWLVQDFAPAHGNANYCAYFFRRALSLIGSHGAIGMLATKSISEARTRTTSLEVMISRGGRIFDAEVSRLWPGEASVRYSTVCTAFGSVAEAPGLRATLDGLPVSNINSFLQARTADGTPKSLSANAPLSFIGNKIYGQGFILSSKEAEELRLSDPRNGEIIEAYLIGEDLNSADGSACREVINFGNRSLQQAREWPTLLKIVEERVRRERESKGDHPLARFGKKYWWQFGSRVDDLYESISGLRRCLVIARSPKHFCFDFAPTAQVFSESLHVFALESFTAFAVLQSRIHLVWATLHGRKTGTAKTPSYAAKRCFDTFPFPAADPRQILGPIEAAGEATYEARRAFMAASGEGLTKAYNAMLDPRDERLEIVELRRLHEAMERAVLDAYGLSEVAVPPYCPRTEEDREAIKQFADKVIDHIYTLNAKRAAEAKALEGKGKLNNDRKRYGESPGTQSVDVVTRADDEQGELF
ncbi:MAG: N-6 DNA methylase, partial [Myxococcales bacterium]|nr:N-6 DNA methylase [Myxococcales bacterium]